MKKYPLAGPWKLRMVEEVLGSERLGKHYVTRARLRCGHIKIAYHGMIKGYKTRCYPCGREAATLRGDSYDN